jgi:hypothetical protein
MHGFDHPDEFRELLQGSSAGREVADMYEAAWPVMWGPRQERIYAHDFHPAELMSALLRLRPPHYSCYSDNGGQVGRYRVSQVGIEHVPHLGKERGRWGEIDLGPVRPDQPLRFLVDGVDTSEHRAILAASLASEPYGPRMTAPPRFYPAYS